MSLFHPQRHCSSVTSLPKFRDTTIITTCNHRTNCPNHHPASNVSSYTITRTQLPKFTPSSCFRLDSIEPCISKPLWLLSSRVPHPKYRYSLRGTSLLPLCASSNMGAE